MKLERRMQQLMNVLSGSALEEFSHVNGRNTDGRRSNATAAALRNFLRSTAPQPAAASPHLKNSAPTTHSRHPKSYYHTTTSAKEKSRTRLTIGNRR